MSQQLVCRMRLEVRRVRSAAGAVGGPPVVPNSSVAVSKAGRRGGGLAKVGVLDIYGVVFLAQHATNGVTVNTARPASGRARSLKVQIESSLAEAFRCSDACLTANEAARRLPIAILDHSRASPLSPTPLGE
ncbi:hypothetical protein MRX96_059821 [Rhipicephalus microplus]